MPACCRKALSFVNETIVYDDLAVGAHIKLTGLLAIVELDDLTMIGSRSMPHGHRSVVPFSARTAMRRAGRVIETAPTSGNDCQRLPLPPRACL